MKNFRALYSFLFLAFFTLGLVGQEDEKQKTVYASSDLFPKKGNVGASIVMDGLIDNFKFSSVSNEVGENILFLKYYLEDDLTLRLGFGFSLDGFNRNKADSVAQTLVEIDSSISSFLLNTSFGIEKHLRPTKRLDPFIFSQIDLTFIGKINTEIENKTTSAAGTHLERTTIKEDGGFAFTLNVGAGMNYFFTERFSVGSELSASLQLMNRGGTISNNQTITPINGNSTSNVNISKDETSTAEISVQPNALLNISYFF